MTVRSFDRSRVEPIPFPLRPLSTSAGTNASTDASNTMSGTMSGTMSSTLAFPKTKARRGRVAYSVAGCLRGLCWAVVIECVLVFCGYEAWHLWRFLR